MPNYVAELRAQVGARPLILPGACVIVLDGAQRILLQQRIDDAGWGLPGGIMELGESLEDTARREAYEEVRIVVNNLKLFRVFSGLEVYHQYPNGDEVYNVVVAFVAESWEGNPQSDGIESSKAAFFPLDELPERLSLDGVVINAFREGRLSDS